jgi:hypothetical protein
MTSGHVARASVNQHPVRLVAARAEDGAADGEDAGERGLVELQPPVLDEAAKAVAEAENFHAVKTERGLADAADGGVESGAVAARRQDADAFCFCHCRALFEFTNPARHQPAGRERFDDVQNPPPPQVAAMLHAACYDCHSNETRWPWYSHIAPMSWLIASDVNEGRENHEPFRLADRPDARRKTAGGHEREIGYGEMPPGKYTAIHADARMTDASARN